MWQSMYLQTRIFDDPNILPFLIFFLGMVRIQAKTQADKISTEYFD